MLKVTPKGTYVSGKVLYPPKLNRPYIFDEQLQRSRPAEESELAQASYEIKIIIEDEHAKKLEKEALRVFGEKYEKKKPKNMPVQYNDEADQWVFKANIRGAYGLDVIEPIPVFDSGGAKVSSDLKIGVGSDVVVKAGMFAYSTGAVSGVTCRLRAVQIRHLVEADEDHGFDVLEGGFTMGDKSDATTSDDLDDDIPF